MRRLRYKYRFKILNETTFEEVTSFRLSRMNLFVAGGVFALFMILVTTLLIAFTPLREYIPGYGSVAEQRKLLELSAMADSMENELLYKDYFIQNVQGLVMGREPVESFKAFKDSSIDYRAIKNVKSPEDSTLRAEMNGPEYTGRGNVLKSAAIVFMPPIKGMVSEPYNPAINHLAMDLTAPKNEVVKAAADGSVILSAWTAETGHVLVISHASDFVSVYKHNASLLKKQGDHVQAGEPVAFVGNSGELTTGPHLHFELWLNGKPVNPNDYITF